MCDSVDVWYARETICEAISRVVESRLLRGVPTRSQRRLASGRARQRRHLRARGGSSREVTVEVDVRRGLPTFTIVGLPDRAVRESRERVRAALLELRARVPAEADHGQPRARPRAQGRARLRPGDRGRGAGGERAGPARGARGHCRLRRAVARAARCAPCAGRSRRRSGRGAAGYSGCSSPSRTRAEAALVEGIEVIGVADLSGSPTSSTGAGSPSRRARRAATRERAGDAPISPTCAGRRDAKRALEIAAAGGHNLLMVGPPGAGKTMLARRLPGILPPPALDEALEITADPQRRPGSASGAWHAERPFRAPHHTISAQGLVGGGSRPAPGRGHARPPRCPVPRRAGRVPAACARGAAPARSRRAASRSCAGSARSTSRPAMLVAACNRCPCARPRRACPARELERGRYLRRLSGPLLDRIDLVCQVERCRRWSWRRRRPRASRRRRVRERVIAARERQRERLAGTPALCNGDMDGRADPPLRSARRRGGGAAARRARERRAHRARARPRAARGAHDRRPGGARRGRGRDDSRRRSATGSTGRELMRGMTPRCEPARRACAAAARHLAPRIAGMLGAPAAPPRACSPSQRAS